MRQELRDLRKEVLKFNEENKRVCDNIQNQSEAFKTDAIAQVEVRAESIIDEVKRWKQNTVVNITDGFDNVFKYVDSKCHDSQSVTKDIVNEMDEIEESLDRKNIDNIKDRLHTVRITMRKSRVPDIEQNQWGRLPDGTVHLGEFQFTLPTFLANGKKMILRTLQ